MLDAATLRKTYIATGLTDDQLNTIGEIGEVRTHSSSHVLARKGDEAEEMFVILNGEVRVTTDDGDLLGIIHAGNIVCEIALVDNRPRAAHVVCIGTTTVAAFNLKQLRKAMLEDKAAGLMIMANIAGVLAARLRNADEMIDHLTDKATDAWAGAHD